MNKEKCLICDLDGSLFLYDHHRGPYEDWKAENDIPNPPVLEILNRFDKDYKILLVSGRDEGRSRIPTEKCLLKHNITYDALWFRKAGDKRKDTIIKREIYEAFIKDNYDVLFIIDDRPCVIRMWKNDLNLFVIDVGKGVEF